MRELHHIAPAMVSSRVRFVTDRSVMYSGFIQLSLEELVAFAASAEEEAHTKSREMTDHLDGNELKLTSHAAHMRSVGSNIVLLRDGLLPAIKIDPDNRGLRDQAIKAFAYIKSEFDAMDCLVC